MCLQGSLNGEGCYAIGHEIVVSIQMNDLTLNISQIVTSIYLKAPLVVTETDKKTRLVTAGFRRNNIKIIYLESAGGAAGDPVPVHRLFDHLFVDHLFDDLFASSSAPRTAFTALTFAFSNRQHRGFGQSTFGSDRGRRRRRRQCDERKH